MQIILRKEIYQKKNINYSRVMLVEEERYVVYVKLIHCQNFR